MAYINSIGTAQAPFSHSQKDILDFMLAMYQVPAEDVEKMTRLYDRSEIETRYSAIEDFSLPKSKWTFIEKDKPVSVEKRMQKYFEIAPALCEKAVRRCLQHAADIQRITHLITVSCTGISAPGLDIQLMRALGLATDVHRSSVNFMGCYAAVHALKIANSICGADPLAKVLIVDVELCTLHFQDSYTMDNIAASLLFGDGAAAVVVSNEPGMYAIQDFYAEVAFSGYNDMAWNISANGFLMTLSGYVPSVIAEHIEPMLLNSLNKMQLSKSDIHHWAIHPGGKKIILEIEKALDLTPADVEVSRSVLSDYGNMSSVTILVVLKRMQSKVKQAGENMYTVAFGPGLSIESMFLKTC